MTDDTAPRTPGKLALVCPRCDKPSRFGLASGWTDATCPVCSGRFRALVATVRAKSSRGDKRQQSRDYRIRIRYADQEELIEFSAGYDEIEMKAGDAMAFLYRRSAPYVVHNLTLGTHTRLRHTQPYLAIAMAVVVTVAVIMAFRFLGKA